MGLRPLHLRAGWLALLALAVIAAQPSWAIAGFHRNGNGYLGVNFANLTPQQRARLETTTKDGVAIAAVDHDAPAGKAGLQANDVILQLNGRRARQADDLSEALHKMAPGETVALMVLRGRRVFVCSIVLADRRTIEEQAWSRHYSVPDPAAPSVPDKGLLGAVPAEIGKTLKSNGGLMGHVPGALPYTGIVFDVMDPQLAQYFGLKNSTGLLVKSVDPKSPGARAGLRAGDVICKANDAPTTSRSRWNRVLKMNRHEAIKLQILRDRKAQTLVLTLAESKS